MIFEDSILEIIKFVIGDRDIAPVLELVSFDDPVTIAGLGVDELLRHAVTGLGVELIEADALHLCGGGAEIDRAGDEQ